MAVSNGMQPREETRRNGIDSTYEKGVNRIPTFSAPTAATIEATASLANLVRFATDPP